ncbi:MAG: hypothetical protein C4519_23425 [Desulfobacteraceae bacterium]|nr:MAG: hypothetical protein C4519_23425 [Desulfobacteraceae bacterium]
MIVQADTLYLPILSPARVEVGSRALILHRAPPRQSGRPQIIPDPRPLGRIHYTVYGATSAEQSLGRVIDLYA